MPAVELRLIVIYTSRLAECRGFYEGLGLEFVPERHGTGPDHFSARLDGGAVLELYPAVEARATGRLRLGLTVRREQTMPPLPPGRHRLSDPDGRAVEVLVEGEGEAE